MKTKSPGLPKILAFLLFSTALAVTGLSVLRINFESLGMPFGLLALTCAFFGARVWLKAPGSSEPLPLFHLFIFVAVLLFDINAAMALTAVAAFYTYARRGKSAVYVLSNSAAPVLSVFIVLQLSALSFKAPAEHARPYNQLIILFLLGFTQSTFQAAISAINSKIEDANHARRFSVGEWSKTCLTYLALASAAGFIVKLTGGLNLSVLAVMAALCALTAVPYLYSLLREKKVAPQQNPNPALPSESHQESESHTEQDDVYRSAFEHAPIGMALVSPEGECLRANRSLCELLGYSSDELQALKFQKLIHPEDVGRLPATLPQVAGESVVGRHNEKRFLHKDGRDVWTLCNISSTGCREAEPEYLIFQIQDISERKRAEGELLHNAFHDALTGLPNRALFIDHLQLAMDRTQRREDEIYAVLFIDLDRFKLINDSLGHLVGDKLLIEIARRLETCLRPGDTIARVGGDEFTVLLEDLQDEPEAISIAHRIQKELSSPFILDGHEVFNTVSIGIAPSSSVYNSPADIMRDADTAMYRAKLLGKNRHEIFDKAMHEAAVDLLQMETDLRHALEREEFFIQYQPIVNLDDFRLCGFEALVRWRHPERGLISPLDFIPVAEDTGQIIHIGQWVLAQACKQMHKWQRRYGMENPLFISVNLSGKQFAQSDLIEQVKNIIADTRLNPRGLKLEITESVVMENIETATQMLQQLRDLGVQLSIDDFGTGYSSLSYLHRFPIDTLKIDKSFVMKMIDNNENIEIVRTIIMLAQNLGMDVIAEGVETKEQLAVLRKLKCEKGQGYYFSRPLEKLAAENLLSDTCTEGNPFRKSRESKPRPVINTRVKAIKIAAVEDVA